MAGNGGDLEHYYASLGRLLEALLFVPVAVGECVFKELGGEVGFGRAFGRASVEER